MSPLIGYLIPSSQSKNVHMDNTKLTQQVVAIHVFVYMYAYV